MTFLIVHADDFGLTEKVNEGIVRSHINGILTSTSIMTCGNAFDHAVKLIKNHTSLDVGIHLTLTEERPLLLPEVIPSLIMNNGHFQPHAKQLFQKYIVNKVSIEDIRKEFSAQIEKALDYGLPISHIDSHQHVHILPKIYKIIIDLAKLYNIRAIRIPNEKLHRYMFGNIADYPRIVQLLIVKTILQFIKKNGAMKSPRFFGFYYGGKLNIDNLKTLIENLPKKGICEIMCHPGLNDINSDYLHWKYNWGEELEALTDKILPSLINKMSISLISYRDLMN